MKDIEEQIYEIIKQRKSHLPQIDEVLNRCSVLRSPLEGTKTLIEELFEATANNSMLANACDVCHSSLQQFIKKLSEIEQQTLTVKKRFLRETINIGFGGPKGMGKSFLLQKISGLTDNEVPSAEGLPVTAVRSVIRNSPENKADITFHSEHSFLEQRIYPLCAALGVDHPKSIQDFRSLKLPEHMEPDRADQYCQKLKDYQQHLHEYASLLTGEKKTFRLSDLRQYVSYSVIAEEHGSRAVPCYRYLAVSAVAISCLFPRTTVQNLLLIDLPGLGELDPSLESIHTEGFKDNLDLCLFLRRPAGTRQDWDREAQAALDTLTQNTPVGRPSDFVLIVLNGGGCRQDMLKIMEEDTRSKLEPRYTILVTSSTDSEGLSRDVLAEALKRLAESLPASDKQLLREISENLSTLTENIIKFCDNAKRTLRQYGQGQDSEEIVRHAAEQAHKRFSDLSLRTLEFFDNAATRQEDLPDVIDTLNEIQAEMDEYLANGMDQGSLPQWQKMAQEVVAQSAGIGGLQIDQINKLRVQIALRFSQELDEVYETYIHNLQQKVVDALNDAEVLNNMLNKETPKQNLEMFINYLDESTLPTPQIREAVRDILQLKIEHNIQFYPRVYDPIRHLKNVADTISVEGNTREEKCSNLYMNLVDMGNRTIFDIRNRIIEETRDNLFNILLVAYEKFDDLIIRNNNVKEEWIRFFKSYFSDIHPMEQKTNKSYLLDQTIKQLETLRTSSI